MIFLTIDYKKFLFFLSLVFVFYVWSFCVQAQECLSPYDFLYRISGEVNFIREINIGDDMFVRYVEFLYEKMTIDDFNRFSGFDKLLVLEPAFESDLIMFAFFKEGCGSGVVISYKEDVEKFFLKNQI